MQRQRSRGWIGAGATLVAITPLAAGILAQAAPAPAARPAPAPAAGRVAYNRDVRPILAENCFACHGPDSAARKADLRLDRALEATALRSGRAAIVPGQPAKSELVRRIRGEGPLMPPAASHKKLTPAQIATLTRWVAQGASYEAHWSLQKPVRPALPPVKDAAWVRNPIDRFVLARLEAAGLRPAPEADRRTLARRLALDLTGLPPDPADVEAFVADRSPDAYEKLVDRFLASPHWGEHRGRYWLDAARYADTHGIHFDNYREMWSYRDWVIQAFNRNQRFDQFTLEQIAGDLLPNPTVEQRVATGFNRCNITTNEGGVIPEEYLVLYTRDRTETVSQVWLGSTAGCAVCHDHKFDPLTQREFYELAAFFNNTTQGAMDGNIKDTPPILPVPLPGDAERLQVIAKELGEAKIHAEARRTAARAEFDRASAGTLAGVGGNVPTGGLQLHLPLSEGEGALLRGTRAGQAFEVTSAPAPQWVPGHAAARAFQRAAGSTAVLPEAGDRERQQAFTVAAWVKIANANQGGALLARMDEGADFRGWDLWLEGGRVGTHVISKWPEDALKVVTRARLTPGRWQHVTVTYTGAGNAAGTRVFIDGVEQELEVQADVLRGSIRTAVPLKLGQRNNSSPTDGAGLHDLRFYDRALPPVEALALARGTRAAYLASRPAEQRTAAERDELFIAWLAATDEAYRTLSQRVAALEGEQNAIRVRGTIAHVTQERPGEAMAHILFRGEYDRRRDAVKADTPDALPPMPADYPRNRLGFARWLLQADHPLTGRVTVNRFWQEVFGTGLVRTAGDFGVTGELPSHPELLDWLATVFTAPAPADRPFDAARGQDGLGWDVKALFRLIVTSATYRQSAAVTPEKKRKDPFNRLLSRSARYRLDAEVIRDYALAASGLLVRKLGGPSVKPYQPDGVWEAVAMIGSNTRDYRRDTGENLYRRSMYTFWKRSAPPASLDIFNAPNRETCVVRRERTNTPLQALVTLNDVQYVEAARHLAQRALKEGGAATEHRLDWMARRLLARPLRPEERAVVQRSLRELEAFYRGHEKEARELIAVGESKPDATLPPQSLAAWTMLANQLMNLDEVLVR